MQTPTVETSRLILRPLVAGDAETIYRELGCNQNMQHYTGWNPYTSLEATRDVLADDEHHTFSWGIESKETGQLVGTLGAYDYEPTECSIEVGYSIFEAAWGNGYASEALGAALEYMATAGIKSFKAWTAADNVASSKVLLKNGFVLVETILGDLDVEGIKYDRECYECLSKAIR